MPETSFNLTIDLETLIIALSALVIGILIGVLVSFFRYRSRLERVTLDLEYQKKVSAERLQAMDNLFRAFQRSASKKQPSLPRLGTTNANKLIGSFESKVIPSAKKFTTLGVAKKKELIDTPHIERRPREVTNQDN